MSKEQMVYAVVVCRSDGNHIVTIESPDYDKCYDKWQTLQDSWASATKEQKPFVIIDPIVTAFAPNMVYEIKLVPTMTQELAQKASNNPYSQRMNEQGFGRSFPGNSVDLLSHSRG